MTKETKAVEAELRADAETAAEAVADAGANLRDKIEAAKVRSAEMAGSSARKARDFVEEHPVAVVAGGLVLGALIAGAFARSRRQDKTASGVIADGSAKLSKLAAIGAELAMAYAAKAAEAGKDGVGRLEDLGGTVGGKISEGGAEAKKRATDIAEIAMAGARGAGEAALRRAHDLAAKIRY